MNETAWGEVRDSSTAEFLVLVVILVLAFDLEKVVRPEGSSPNLI